MLNLFSNAVKFTHEDGRVAVSAQSENDSVTIKITDTGIGIDAERLPYLTDPFVKAHNDPYLSDQGTGLGLTITKSLIDLHDGTMDIVSELGQGTTVTVTLPIG